MAFAADFVTREVSDIRPWVVAAFLLVAAFFRGAAFSALRVDLRLRAGCDSGGSPSGVGAYLIKCAGSSEPLSPRYDATVEFLRRLDLPADVALADLGCVNGGCET